jgi:16S rRNA (cytosine1402-N4)-methyltransferase
MNNIEPPIHLPVLPKEVRHASEATTGEIWVDGTAGGGGHTADLLQAVQPNGQVVAIDRDPTAASKLQSRFDQQPVTIVNDSYHHLPLHLDHIAETFGVSKPLLVDGILLDLGLSSDQLADRERGFSFHSAGPLDLRYNPTEGESAAELLRYIGEEELANIIYQYGEERFSRRIARRIVEQRRSEPIETAKQLADLIHRSVPGRVHGRVDSATRTFQALRIAVNRELEIVEEALRELPKCLKPGGRFLVISFHSLEDRLVKHIFREHPLLEVVTKKPIEASPDEERRNPRSRSAKLRVAKRRDAADAGL